MGKKVLDITVNASGAAGSYLHKAVQRVLIDCGFEWGGSGKKDIHDFGSNDINANIESDGRKVIWQFLSKERETTKVTATDILSGAFDLDKWIKYNTPKKDVVYCVDLTWVKGEAREVLSAALQKKAFEKGYKWSVTDDTTVQHKDQPGLFFDTRDATVCFSYDFNRGKDSCKYNATAVEISVNKALRGEYRSVK